MRMLTLLLGVQLHSLFSSTLAGKKKKRTLPLILLVSLCLQGQIDIVTGFLLGFCIDPTVA